MQTDFVLGWHPLDTDCRVKFAKEFPDLRWVEAAEQTAQNEWLPRAEVIYGRLPSALVPPAERLRWLQVPFAGVSQTLCAAAQKAGVIVTNAAGVYNQTIVQHVIALMLALTRRLHACFEQQQARLWQTPKEPLADLTGNVVGILGTGRIGQGVARVCRGFGMRTLGCRRNLQPTPFFDRVFAVDQLAEMAAEVDWLVSAIPHTAHTERMIDRAVLAAMKPGAYFINVSRGKVVDEQALTEALSAGRLAGAGLDVTVDEPLPAASPLLALSNVIITPHLAGNPSDRPGPGPLFLRNLHNYRAGLPLENVVDLEQGY